MPHRALVDTGSSCCLLSDDIAKTLNVTCTHKTVPVRGVGLVQGRESKLVQLQIDNKNMYIRVIVLSNIEQLPLILGLPTLRRLGFRCSLDQAGASNNNNSIMSDSVALRNVHDLTCAYTHCHAALVTCVEVPVSLEDSLIMIREATDSSLTSAQRDTIVEIFNEYVDVWFQPPGGGTCTAGLAQVEVVGRPFCSKLRPLNTVLRDECRRQLDKLLKEELISPSKSSWAAAPVFIQKKDGSWRMALDYRQLNKQTIPDVYPIPNLWDCIRYAGGKTHVIVLDLVSGFWNVRLTEESRVYTAFITPFGLFEWSVMPFGLRNAPSEFQRIIDFALRNTTGVIAYIDDIIISACDWNGLTTKLRDVLLALRNAGLHLNIKKAQLNCVRAKVLGHLVSVEGIRADPGKVNAINTLRPPKSKDELRSFLGMLTFLNKYIENMSLRAKCLTDLLAKRVAYTWTNEHQSAFRDLKMALSEEIMLQAPDDSREVILECDASGIGLGAVLKQIQQGKEVVIEYASKKLNATQMKWNTREREAYSIRWALEHFSPLIRGLRIHLRTDHQSLTWMTSSQESKVYRWLLYMQQYDIDITHISGKANNAADYLSRGCADDPEDDKGWEDIQVPESAQESICKYIGFAASTTNLNLYVPKVPKVEDLLKALEEHPVASEETKWLYKGNDGLYYHVHTHKLYVPGCFRRSFIFWHHSGRYGGHSGMTRTLQRLKTKVWWLNMNKDVCAYVHACEACARNTPPNKPYLNRILESPLPFQTISFDFVGPRTYKYKQWWYAVLVDHCTRYVIGNTIMHPPTHHDVLRILHLQWVTLFGAPASIIMDNDSIYTKEVKDYLTLQLGCRIVHSSPGYPQGNSLNETTHKSIEKSVAIQVQTGAHIPFESLVAEAIFAHNLTPNVHVGDSPYRRLFGMEAGMPHSQEISNMHLSDHTRRMLVMEGRVKQTMLWNMTRQKELLVVPCSGIKEGDTIVYYKSEWQRRHDEDRKEQAQYTSAWSLPQLVIEVKQGCALVRELHKHRSKPRQVPLRLCRRLTSLKDGLRGDPGDPPFVPDRGANNEITPATEIFREVTIDHLGEQTGVLTPIQEGTIKRARSDCEDINNTDKKLR